MCGIAGILDLSGRPVEASLIERMTETLAHRGPDDSGVWTDGSIGFGHRRLSIRDLSAAGHQPMSDPSGRVTITYNGELYNDAALRRELERDHGARFASSCDSEIIPAGYLAWGEEVFERLEGMFALALWDARQKCLFLVRDAVGIKPLVVSHANGRVRFASELKSLLADPEQPRRLDGNALHAYMAQGYVSPDRTLLEGVEQLAPGTVRRIDRDGIRERSLPLPQRRPEIRRLDEAVEAFLEVWEPTLEAMLVSDVPVGVLQSGGIDSSLVALGLSRRSEIDLFVAGFEDASHDESRFAEKVAGMSGKRLHRVPVDDVDPVETFRTVVRHFDGQLADSSGLAVYALSRVVRRHTKVVLSGDGADEFFAGYTTYRATRLAGLLGAAVPSRWLSALGERAWAQAGGRSERLPMAAVLGRFLLGAATGAPGCHAEWRRLLPRHAIARLYGAELLPMAERDPLAGYRAAIDAGSGDAVERCLAADQRYYLPSDMLMKVDAMSMAHGLEVRVPFLHPRIVDVASRLDATVLTSIGGPDKRTLRAALARLGGPPEVVSGAKLGFNVPVNQLLTGPLASLGDRLLDREADHAAPWFDPDGLRAMWREQRAGAGNHGYALWALLSLAEWREAASV